MSADPFYDEETQCRHGKDLGADCDLCWLEAQDYVAKMREFVEKNTAPRSSC